MPVHFCYLLIKFFNLSPYFHHQTGGGIIYLAVSNQTKLENSNTELISLVKAAVAAQEPKGVEGYMRWIPPMMLEMTFKKLYYSNHDSFAVYL